MEHIMDARTPLGMLPTPLHRLANISKMLGKNVYIKRDDMTGVATGGNKVRKLEYLLHDALTQGCDIVLTTGAAQSNHAMLTAACCNVLRLKCILMLRQGSTEQMRGNQVLYDLLGAQVRYLRVSDYDDIAMHMKNLCAALRQDGHTPYSIPLGGSVALGSLGYVRCMQEIAWQAEIMGIRVDDIVCAEGSGGTHAGLALGAALHSPHTRVTGIVVGEGHDFSGTVAQLFNEAAALLDSGLRISKAHVSTHDCYGPGYGLPSTAGVAAMRLIAEQDGIILDPVYTGKGFAGLLELHAQGYFHGRENIMFLHSGGIGGLFATDIGAERP